MVMRYGLRLTHSTEQNINEPSGVEITPDT